MSKREYLISARGDTRQRVIAERCGMSAQAYCQIESGKRQKDMSISALKKIAGALNVPFHKLVAMEMEYIKSNE